MISNLYSTEQLPFIFQNQFLCLVLNHFVTQFPLFQHHPNLVYLDSAATTQKPKIVIDGICHFYEKENAKHPSRDL